MEKKENIEEILKNFEKNNSGKTVFGEPIKQGDVLIVPVSMVKSFYMGKKGNQKEDASNEGQCGLINKSKPIGYIEIIGKQTSFISIIDKGWIYALGIAVFGAGFLSIMRYFRKRKKKVK